MVATLSHAAAALMIMHPKTMPHMASSTRAMATVLTMVAMAAKARRAVLCLMPMLGQTLTLT